MSFIYSYNDLNQRTAKELESGDKWVYDYDSFGQVTSAHKEDSTEALWPGYDFGYTFDDIGNRLTAVQNGETSTYTPTLVNQYTQRTVPGMTQIRGQADSAAVVTVNTESVTRKDDYFFKKLTIDNSIDSVWESITVRGVLAEAGRDDTDAVAEEELGRWVPETPEAFDYDDDGNLTQDGRWDYTWNGENRLVAMETRSVAYTAGAPRERLEFIYDSQGRRVQKTHLVWDEVEAAFVEKCRDLFLYDGWNLLAELRAVDGAAEAEMHRRYAWSMDLSGSLQGAGGVGGLVMIILADETVLYPAYDGNGNVMGLFDPGEDDWVAVYEYGAFGEPLRATGPLADANPFQFSTKYTDTETDLVYYGFRYYVPEIGRWLNRDPIGEEGGVNLYAFVGNDGVNGWDLNGLVDFRKMVRDYASLGSVLVSELELVRSNRIGRQLLDNIIKIVDGCVCKKVDIRNISTGEAPEFWDPSYLAAGRIPRIAWDMSHMSNSTLYYHSRNNKGDIRLIRFARGEFMYHELYHYFQWLSGLPKTERCELPEYNYLKREMEAVESTNLFRNVTNSDYGLKPEDEKYRHQRYGLGGYTKMGNPDGRWVIEQGEL